MSGKTMWQSDRVLSLLKGSSVIGAPATYINLFITLPTGDNNAVSGGSLGTEWVMSRVEVSQDGRVSPYWSGFKSDGDKRYIDNVGTITWTYDDPAVSPGTSGTDDQVTVLGVGVWDSTASDANLLYWKAFDESRLITQGEEVLFASGQLKVRED